MNYTLTTMINNTTQPVNTVLNVGPVIVSNPSVEAFPNHFFQTDTNAYQAKPPRGVGGYLLKAWLGTYTDLGLPATRFEVLLEDYIRVHTKSLDKSNASKVLTKGNLRRELIASDSLTWRSFLRGICILKATALDVTTKLTWSTGKSSMHTIQIDLKEDMDVKEPVQDKMAEEKPRLTVNEIAMNPELIFPMCKGHGGHLIRLWYTILSDMKMRQERFKYLLTTYAKTQDTANADKENYKPSSTSSLSREFVGEHSLTWRAFIRGLIILKVKDLEFNFRLHFESGKTSIHSININLRQSSIEEEPDLTPEDIS